MGYAVTWCAIREEKAGPFLQHLGLSPTGKTEPIPESLISMTRLDSGWRVIWYNKYGCPFLRSQDLRDLSTDKEILLCLVEEHVMASSAEMWSHGRREWWLSHEGEDGPKGLSTDGQLPQSFPAIRNEMERAQLAAGGDEADVDYIFEIPLKVAEALVGFKHDDWGAHLIDGHFAVLSRPAGARGLLRRLFSK
jgi:hypothetical protein